MVSVLFPDTYIFTSLYASILTLYNFLFLFIQATQGVLSMEASVIRMTDELQKKGADYKKLEDQHFKNVNVMKEAEERARAEVENREKIEVELAELKEKVKKLESECISSIGKA